MVPQEEQILRLSQTPIVVGALQNEYCLYNSFWKNRFDGIFNLKSKKYAI